MFFIIRCDAFFPSRVLKHVSIQLVEVEKKTTTQVRMRGACQESRAKKSHTKIYPFSWKSAKEHHKKSKIYHIFQLSDIYRIFWTTSLFWRKKTQTIRLHHYVKTVRIKVIGSQKQLIHMVPFTTHANFFLTLTSIYIDV